MHALDKKTRVGQANTTLRELVDKTGTLGDRCGEAAHIRQSLELGTAASSYNSIWGRALVALNGLHDEMPDDDLAAAEQLAVELNTQFEGQKFPRVIGMAHDAKQVTHYCVTADKTHGYGVYSAHDNKCDAQYNATITGGKCVAVSRHEEGGAIIKPQAVRDAERLKAEYC